MDLNALIHKLERIDYRAAERLAEINAAIEGGNFSTLTAIDIYGAINPAGIESRAAEQIPGPWSLSNKVISLLEWVRNFMVLIPITITWISFWSAAQDYAEAINRNHALGENSFLFLWETGYGGVVTPSWLTFSQTALVDASILGLIVLITFIVHFWKDVICGLTASRAASLRQDLERALWEIEKKLSEKRYQQAEHGMVERISDTVAEFQTTAAALASSVNTFQGNAKDLMEFTQALDLKIGTAAEAKQSQVDDLTEFNKNLRGTVKHMLDQVKEASVLYQGLKDAMAALSTAAGQTSEAQARILAHITKVDDNLKMVAAETRALGEVVQSAVTELHTATTGNRELVMSGAAAVGQVADLFAIQLDVRSSLAETNKKLQELVTSIQKSADAVDSLPDKLRVPIRILEVQAEGLSKSSVELANKHATALQTTATQMNQEVLAYIKDSNSQLQREIVKLEEIFADLAGRQAMALDKIANELAATSESFLKRSNQLAGTLQSLSREHRGGGLTWLQVAIGTGLSTLVTSCLLLVLGLGFLRYTGYWEGLSSFARPLHSEISEPTGARPVAPTSQVGPVLSPPATPKDRSLVITPSVTPTRAAGVPLTSTQSPTPTIPQ